MTLQQLRYLIAIAELGSINAAAQRLYASQSNLSTAMKELERELGITIFRRSNRGVTLTNEGAELVSYARQVVEQADMLEARYTRTTVAKERLAISSQHYAFCVQAFIATAGASEASDYDYILRETTTQAIIDDVRTFRSDVGVLFTDGFNSRVLWKAFDDAGLMFYPLFEAPVHVFVGSGHPLAGRDAIDPDELSPYPRYSFEQGAASSLYFSEEPLAYLPHARTISYTDRGTLTNLLTSFEGYTLSTGVLSEEMGRGIASIPLAGDARMTVGYLVHRDRKASALLHSFIGNLKRVIQANPSVTSYLAD